MLPRKGSWTRCRWTRILLSVAPIFCRTTAIDQRVPTSSVARLPSASLALDEQPKPSFETTARVAIGKESTPHQTTSPWNGSGEIDPWVGGGEPKIRGGAKDAGLFAVPSWRDVLEVPVKVPTLDAWRTIPRAKRVAMMARASTYHLTLLSSLGPLVVRGAVLAGGGTGTDPLAGSDSHFGECLTPWTSLAWMACMVSWNLVHNMLNDLQDLHGDDAKKDAFRPAYGVHVLKQNFVTKNEFLRTMAGLAIPAVALSLSFLGTEMARSFLRGTLAMLLYTPIFKPLAIGEALIYYVWGPLIAGFGFAAASTSRTAPGPFSPAVSIFGSLAVLLVFGEHTDKIDRSEKRTLPAVLGKKVARAVCCLLVIAPQTLLIWGLFVGRRLGEEPVLPLGASAAFLSFPIEGMTSLKVLLNGRPLECPSTPWVVKGIFGPFNESRIWPLYFGAVLGWYGVTFGYLLLMGSGLEWILRAVVSRLLFWGVD